MIPPSRSALQALIDKWRLDAKDERERAAALKSGEPVYPREALILTGAYCLEQVADDLSALLASWPPDPQPEVEQSKDVEARVDLSTHDGATGSTAAKD